MHRGRFLLARFSGDRRGLAAVEFAFIVPLMLTMIFGTIEISSGVAIDRKVTLTARSLSDLVSQGTRVTPTDLKNFFGLGTAIMTPYAVTSTTMTQRLTEVSIDSTKKATVVWSYVGTVASGTATLSAGYAANAVITTIPPDLLVANTKLIWSEVTYNYTPIVGYVVTGTIPLKDQCFTRPRQSDSVDYSSS